jgi:transposase
MSAPLDTPEAIARLRAMRARGMTNRECHVALGIADATLRRWIDKHRIVGPRPHVRTPMQPLNAASVARVREMRAQGIGWRKIAAALGVSSACIQKTIRVQRIPVADAVLAQQAKKPPAPRAPKPPRAVPAPRAQRPPTGPALARNSTWAPTPTAERKPAQQQLVAAVPDPERIRPAAGAMERATFGCPCCSRALLGPLVGTMAGWKGARLWN